MVREIFHWKLENFLQQKNKKMATTFEWTISALNSRIKETIEGQELHDVVIVVHCDIKAQEQLMTFLMKRKHTAL